MSTGDISKRKQSSWQLRFAASMAIANGAENLLVHGRDQKKRYLIAKNSISPSQSPSNDSISISLFFLGGSVMLLVLLVLIAILWKCCKSSVIKKILAPNNKVQGVPDLSSRKLGTISQFSYQTLKRATGNFNPNNQLGEGGFGPVYKGVLDDGRMIAVKKLALGKSEQGDMEFLAEVRMITNIQHRNLVQLLGCCSDGPHRLLVYEYMVNGSLDAIVYGKSDLFLDWKNRFQIILGIARGLQYLHEDSHLRIVHRDIKASNVLLDDKFQPRIGDFGLAMFFPEDQAYLSTTLAGTLGYTAPEYATRGELTEKADIYSFGVLVLEIVSSRRNTDHTLPSDMQYLPEYASKLYERSRVIDMVDPKLQSDGFVEGEILQAIYVALLCLRPDPVLRPRMSEIVTTLTCNMEMVATPMKPAYLDRRQWYDYEDTSWETRSGNDSHLPSGSPSPH